MTQNKAVALLAILVMSFISLTSCVHQDASVSAKPEVLSSSVSPPLSSQSSLADEKKREAGELDPSKGVQSGCRYMAAPQEYGVYGKDLETAIRLCRDALSQFYHASCSGAPFDYGAFFDNVWLEEYTRAKIETYQAIRIRAFDHMRDISDARYSDFVSAMDYICDTNIYRITVISVETDEYGIAFQPTEFLVQTSAGRLVIADWFSPKGVPLFLDDIRLDYARETDQLQYLEIDNPSVWEDETWADEMIRRVRNRDSIIREE